MKAPIIDNRKLKNLIEEMKELAPHFTPEWKFHSQSSDVGTALFLVVALQLQESIDLLNLSLDKNFVSFLNYLNISLKPPKPAKLPLVFNLSEGSTDSISLKKGVRVFGRSEIDDKILTFETNTNMEISPSKLINSYCTCAREDFILHIENINSENVIFDLSQANMQKHELYISLNHILICSKPTIFEIILDYDLSENAPDMKLLGDKDLVSWSYFSHGQWIEFEEIYVEKNTIKLLKDNFNKIDVYEELEARCLRCSVKEDNIFELENVFIDNLFMRSRLHTVKRGIEPEGVYYNDKSRESKECFPFGEFFNQFDTFYINSDDVLSKKNSTISIIFDLELFTNKLSNKDANVDWKLVMKAAELNRLEDPVISIHTVKWHYWNGIRWELLNIDKKFERIFYYLNRQGETKVDFVCPLDIETTNVNGQDGYFIKIVVDRIENYVHPDGKYMSPKIKNLRVSYDYKEKSQLIEQVLSYNNLQYEDLFNKVVSNGVITYPFKGVDNKGNALYLKLSQPMENCAVNLLVLMNKENNKFLYNKNIEVEYFATERGMNSWRKIKVNDETKGFTQDGIITTSVMNNFAKIAIFGEKGYWIRILFGTNDVDVRYLKGIYLNGVWATQQLSKYEEYIDVSEENKELFLNETPIIDIELWVNEIDNISSKDIDEIIKNKSLAYKDFYDSLGLLREFWIKWRKTDHFYKEGENDRVYKIDEITGSLQFGNGIRGKLPPTDHKKSIYVNYKVGGGLEGNIKAFSTIQLEEPLAFIDNVINPDNGYGGSDMEALNDAMIRGVNTIRHRNRAVTLVDIQDIVKTVSSEIFKVKCIKRNKNKEEGSLLIIVLLRDKILEGMSYTLKKAVEEFLYDKIPTNLCEEGKIQISDPEIVKLDLKITLTVKRDSDKVLIRENLKKIIEQFLDYKVGNFNNRGWEIGEIPTEYTFYSILSDEEGVLNIDDVSMSTYIITKFSTKEISLGDVYEKENVIIVSGNHSFEIRLT